jgi:hypothetical protein
MYTLKKIPVFVSFAIAAAFAAADVSAAPGANFNLGSYNLQLPVLSNGSVKQVSGSQLEGGYSDAYFYSGSSGQMVFWAPVTGGTTPNSKYPRSELRQVSPSDWSLSGTHTLTATCKVTKVPSNGRVIIGQIHGNASGSEVCKLLWNSGAVEFRYKTDARVEQGFNLGNYNVGTTLNYTIRCSNKAITVTVNGRSATRTYSNSMWQSDRYYFKAGSYVQDNTGTSSEGARVEFTALSTSH